MKLAASNGVIAELTEAVRVLNVDGGTAKARADALEMLAHVGIDEDTARQFWQQMQLPGGSTEFSGGRVVLPNTESWSSPRLVRAFGAAANTIVDDLIVTPALDRPAWMDRNMAFRLLAQFRSFTYTSTNRVMVAGLQAQDMALVQGTAFSLALGAISYYTWAQVRGGESKKRAMEASTEAWIYESLSRSGLLGVLSEGQRVGEQVPWLNDYAVFGGEQRSQRRATSVMGQVLGPTYDLAERLTNVALGMDEPTQSTLHNARVALAPYQNAHIVGKAYDAFEAGIADLLDIPESRE